MTATNKPATPQNQPETVRSSRVRAYSLWAASLVAGCAILAISSLVGCSGGTGGGAASASTDAAKAAVSSFLEAIKRGDDEGARAMLTKVARAKTQEMGISVAPPVSTSATYSIRECEVVADTGDLVHVGTTWTDTDPDGFTTTENVVWAVRLDPEGWRVVGMATRIFDDLPPLLLNFEDPEDMIAKQELVAAEIQKRAAAEESAKQPETRTAVGPADGQRK